ncbi:MAG: 3-deoxy-7-phosphoheptulonate synthase [Dehalococcoidia bacterium]|nr:3-deoxy-7-phosphoheptulonate synthase [Dehalococcoidia bacterium]
MIVVMKQQASEAEVKSVADHITRVGLKPSISSGSERIVIGILGKIYPELQDELEVLSGVVEVIKVSRPFKLSSREFHPADTVVKVGNVAVGGKDLAVMAGPCSVESEEQVVATAKAVKAAGANIFRGGAFKPRSSPYSFRGLGVEGLKYLAAAREATGLPIITEVLAEKDVEAVYKYADVLQVGARNMQNFTLLDEMGKLDKPVMLKRGLSATIEEWLLAAEYILAGGNPRVILCERGIRTYETYTRNTLDLSAIPVIKKISHLPIVADPSHGTGKWYLVGPMASAAVAAGAHGIMIEVHPTPDTAKSDGAQSLTFANFATVMEQVNAIRAVVSAPKSRAKAASK